MITSVSSLRWPDPHVANHVDDSVVGLGGSGGAVVRQLMTAGVVIDGAAQRVTTPVDVRVDGGKSGGVVVK